MKRYLLSFAAVLTFLSCDAQSLLRIRTTDGSRINVAVNGRYFQRRGTSVTVGDLPPGSQYVKIYTVATDRWGRAYEEMIYQGHVTTYDNMLTLLQYDPYNQRVSINDHPLANVNDQSGPYSSYNMYPGNKRNPQRDERTYTRKRYKGGDEDATQQPDVAANDDAPTTTMPVASPVREDIPSGSFTADDMSSLKQKVRGKRTDTEKLKAAKDALKRETVNTQQVKEIMEWFLFESTRVEFAKFAYDNTLDKGNYPDLESGFSYQSSKDELKQYVQSK